MLTTKYLRESLMYSPDTGVFTWKRRPIHHFKSEKSCKKWNSRYAGLIAGSLKKQEFNTAYWRIAVCNQSYKAHRLAWFYITGEWPDEVDHIDGDGLNNKYSNLRNVTCAENRKNMPRQKNNTSGLPGISWDKQRMKWHAYIKTNGIRTTIGHYLSFFEACCARKSAEILYGFHKNHGREQFHGAQQ